MNELETASREELIALIHAQQATIVQQQAVIAELQATVKHLEQRVRELESGHRAPSRMPGHKPEQAKPRPKHPRRKRTENHARRRSEPTAQVEHALDQCPRCGIRLAGGGVKRTREVIEITPGARDRHCTQLPGALLSGLPPTLRTRYLPRHRMARLRPCGHPSLV